MAYDSSDPRSTLPQLASRVPKATSFSPTEYVRFYDEQPTSEVMGRRTWHSRGQNFVLEFSEIDGDVVLGREDQPDEYMLILPDDSLTATVVAGEERVEVPGRSLVIVPPGDSTVQAVGKGRLVRLLSDRAADLAARAINAESYAEPHANVAPIEPWPEPRGGFKVRVYDLSQPPLENPKFRLYRSTNLMVNYFDPSQGPRDTSSLSPHSHDDFEQCSLVLEGEFVHHIRWPWLPDMAQWRDDEHERIGAPSVTVIPAQAEHTSQGVDPVENRLIDIFSPPRMDFSLKGWVLNADEYPMPS